MAKTIKKPVVKKAVKKSAASKKTSSRKSPSEKEQLQKEANKIINSSPKTKGGKKRVKVTTKEESSSLLDAIIEGMQEKKGKNISILNLKEIESRVCDYFVICDADSNTHVDAIAGSVEELVKGKTGEKPYHTEGYQNAEWILVDYINIVVHIFQRSVREFYNIESLWADAEITTIKD
ncbi:MAG TPA: ribosome silencing factor [Nitrosopumilaceae archaeon]|jgi:ribosome-associated protein|nr:ribosome silencing factor [Nitrosopumilaceae archaeon]